VSSSPRILKIAILAMGGEGGGVVADWLVSLAEFEGWRAQSTSVPGVAQRTGATIYYVEMFDASAAADRRRAPVFALMPLPGDVDIVLASELMEAGRAVQRGLVTPDRTTLVASTHRVYAVAEKIALGDGRADAAALLAETRAAAQRCVAFDMARLAEEQGSVISAVLFGALAGTGVLPFARAQFEATIERGGVGVEASLRAFAAAFGAASCSDVRASGDAVAAPEFQLPRSGDAQVQALINRAARDSDEAALPIVIEGLRRLVDYQGPAYAELYLDRLAKLPAHPTLKRETARHLALWMSYEDTIRVADLKTRDTRFARVRSEVRLREDQLLAIHEYLHPRLQEIAETLPAALGRWLLGSGLPRRIVERFAARGRTVQTSGLRGFALLRCVAALRRWRPASLRFQVEQQRIEAWLADIAVAAQGDPHVAIEIARCQRLVKGYGDTHARGWRNFEALRAAWQRAGSQLSAATLAELRNAALADEHGLVLQATLKRHALV
jgi:indolepyruvate ferredoxin oxidoreductase beta subunit